MLAVLAGCRDEMPPFELVEIDPTVAVRFNLVNGTKSLEPGDAFTDNAGYAAQFNKLKFYISDMKLLTSDGSSVSLAEAELVDFSETLEGQAVAFTRVYEYIVPKGNYTTLQFSLGLPPELNSSDPTTFPNDHPLSVYAATYWDWASMYKFIEMGARVDTNDDQVLDFNMEFHTGTDSLFKPGLKYTMALELGAFERETLEVNIDWNKLFHTAEHVITFESAPFTHTVDSPEQLELAKNFTENFVAAISVSAGNE